MVFDSFSDNESHQQLPVGHATKGLWLVIWPCDRDEKCLPRSWNLQEASCLVTSIPSTPRDKPKPVIMFRSQHACVWGSAATRTRRRIWPGGQVGPDRQNCSGLFWRPVSTTTWTLLSFLWWLGVPFLSIRISCSTTPSRQLSKTWCGTGRRLLDLHCSRMRRVMNDVSLPLVVDILSIKPRK